MSVQMDQKFNLYVGSETGLLKGINVDKKTWCNINSVEQASRSLEIKVMCWADSEKEVCIALRNQSVCVFNTEQAEVTQNFDFSTGKEDLIIGLGKFNGQFLTCYKSGLVKLWQEDQDELMEIQVGQGVEKMRQNNAAHNLIATGGKENDLKLWDLQNPTEPIFKAKNVRNDWLNLQVPVHVKDIAFIPGSQKIVTCTAAHQVRLYDPSTPQRRPVLDMEWGEYPITALSLKPNSHQVLVGNTHGDMALLDIRKKGYEVQKYKGFAGAIRDIQCHKSLDLVASCGLDRFLRIHDINSKDLLHKFYLKSKLNCLLFSSDPIGGATATSGGESGVDTESEHSAEEDVWDKIPVVQTKTLKRKSSSSTKDSSLKHDINDESKEEESESPSNSKKKVKKSKKKKDEN